MIFHLAFWPFDVEEIADFEPGEVLRDVARRIALERACEIHNQRRRLELLDL